MSQAKVNNHTALSYQLLFVNDEAFRPILAPIIKATFDIQPDGRLTFAKEQLPICLDGEFVGDPESSSYIYEPECAFTKPATDVVIIGDAISSRGPQTHLLVDIRVGPLAKRLGIIGDRQWLKQSVGYSISAIEPFETMPLIYENAFGGWDKRGDDPLKYGFESRNTVGKGFFCVDIESIDTPMWLPNIENPDALIENINDRPEPAGCGFTLPHWQPRALLAGTYDEAWQSERSPLLPEDFDRRYFNAASPGLIADGHFYGNEAVQISNMTASGTLQFNLPGAKPPICQVELKDEEKEISTYLDTVVINTRTLQVELIWRNYLLLATGPHDVEAVDVHYG